MALFTDKTTVAEFRDVVARSLTLDELRKQTVLRLLDEAVDTSGKPVGENGQVPENLKQLIIAISDASGANLKVTETQTVHPSNLPSPVRVGAYAAVPVASVGPIQLARTAAPPTPDLALWGIIRARTGAVSFNTYKMFVQSVLDATETGPANGPNDDRMMRAQRIVRTARGFGTEGYDFLKELTEAFLLSRSGVVRPLRPTFPESKDGTRPNADRQGRIQVEDDADDHRSDGPFGDGGVTTPADAEFHRSRLADIAVGADESELQKQLFDHLANVKGTRLSPWIKVVLNNLKALKLEDESTNSFELQTCCGIVPGLTKGPLFLELLWSYWHEEGSVPRTMAVISQRFQNKAPASGFDPLAGLELAPLRDVSNLLWGYVQSDYQRLTRQRRAYEYEHEYGLGLTGSPRANAADRRSAFIGAFHNLLRETTAFYLQDDHTTVVSDAFPVLNALKDVHLILSQGAHNQYGDLPWTSRVELLTEMYILALPELREYLGNRPMVPYPEAWMGQVEGVRSLYRWGNQPMLHYSNLASFGEKLLLSIRHNDWLSFNDPNSAKNWAKYWRPEVQGYVHAYRAVRGVDLGQSVDARVLDERGIVQTPRRLRAARP